MKWAVRVLRRIMGAVTTAVALNAGVPAVAACPIVGSRYTGEHGAVATFRNVGRRTGWVSDLALGIQGGQGLPTHWFLFDRGSARYINLISTTDVTRKGWAPPSPDGGERPLGDMHFISATRSLAVTPTVPTSRDAAPSYLMLPDLPEVLARRATPPEDIRLFFFKLAHCGS